MIRTIYDEAHSCSSCGECTYDAVRNEMLADLIVIREGKEERSERKVLPFMREDGNVPELMKRFEAARRQTPRRR